MDKKNVNLPDHCCRCLQQQPGSYRSVSKDASDDDPYYRHVTIPVCDSCNRKISLHKVLCFIVILAVSAGLTACIGIYMHKMELAGSTLFIITAIAGGLLIWVGIKISKAVSTLFEPVIFLSDGDLRFRKKLYQNMYININQR